MGHTPMPPGRTHWAGARRPVQPSRPGRAGARDRAGRVGDRDRPGAPGGRGAPAAAAGAGHRGADPGRPAGRRPDEVRRAGRHACCSPPTAWSRPPGSRSPTTGPPGSPAAGLGSVLDLCCGIGSDALAFARAGLRVEAVERDPATAAVAAANTAGQPVRISIGAAEQAGLALGRVGVPGPGPARRPGPDLRPGGLLARLRVRRCRCSPAPGTRRPSSGRASGTP